MPQLRSLTSGDPVECPVEYGTETIALIVDRGRVTPNWGRRLQVAIAAQNPVAAAEGLEEVISSWDILDEDGATVAITADVLADLPTRLLGMMYQRIAEVVVPSSEEKNVSSVPSSTPRGDFAEPLETHRNGADHSSSPEPSASLSTS